MKKIKNKSTIKQLLVKVIAFSDALHHQTQLNPTKPTDFSSVPHSLYYIHFSIYLSFFHIPHVHFSSSNISLLPQWYQGHSYSKQQHHHQHRVHTMEGQDLSPSHVDTSRPSLGFPLGTALLLIIIFSLSGIFSCCYHWDKLRSFRQSLAHPHPTPSLTQSQPSTVIFIKKKKLPFLNHSTHVI